jgi:hypothetical protein
VKFLTKHELRKLHQRLGERAIEAVVEVSATPAKQKMVATEQESMQTEKEDTTQLYIGPNIIENRFTHQLVH